MWNFVTLSTPNSTSEPHGKVTPSATPRSMMSRTSGAEDCTLVPPSSVTKLAMVASAGRIFMPLTSSGTTIFLVREWNEDGEWMKARQNLTSSISVGIFPVPGIQPHRTALGVRHQERKLAGADDRETAGLI